MTDWIDWTKTATYWGIAGGVAGVAAFAWLCSAGVTRWRAHRVRRATAVGLTALLLEAGDLLKAMDRGELPRESHNAWVARAEKYLRNRLGSTYVARFSNFAGIMFFGNTSPESKLRNDIKGRSQRLHEFVSELREGG